VKFIEKIRRKRTRRERVKAATNHLVRYLLNYTIDSVLTCDSILTAVGMTNGVPGALHHDCGRSNLF
jgi:predicted tellurium resistance membrane protein TerC